MSAATHLGIRLREYDARIRTFIPRYDEMLDAAASALAVCPRAARVVDLGTGTGALAGRVLTVRPHARVTGIDADADILRVAARRLGGRFSPIVGNFQSQAPPPADAITSSFALHHIRTTRAKAALYARWARALGRGGLLVSADCVPATDTRLRRRDRLAWRAHLERRYTSVEAARFLRIWGREDVYLPLDREVALLESAGLVVDVAWRRGAFAVLVGIKRG